MNKKLLCFFLLTTFLFSGNYIAQTITIDVGTGSGSNSQNDYPAPYGNFYQGAKHQMLIQASELTALGVSAGNIYSLAFDVTGVNGVQLEDFTIGIKLTTQNSVNMFQTGLTNVFGPVNYTETTGYNTHTFSSPFYWDGTSNVLVQTCFRSGNWSANASTAKSSTSFQSTLAYFDDNDPNICGSGFVFNMQGYNERPNMRLEMDAPQQAPDADFNVSALTTCTGTIIFTDNSNFSPTSWEWDFGDGNTSTTQHPTHTYTTNGTYDVTLIVHNQYGSDTLVQPNLITVNTGLPSPIAANCIPSTVDGSIGFGITNVSFNTINNASGSASQGYGDYTCSQTTVYAGHTYAIDIQHATPTTHNCVAWIDFNNDGDFDNTTERIISSSNSSSTSGNVVIPSTAVLNTPLRMRVSADYSLSNEPTPCDDLDYGQAEDYTVIVELDSVPPTADFESDVVYTCSGVVNFDDLSTNVPFSWNWDFGDGGTSLAQNPTHTYVTDGVYDVTLIATNQFGSDTITYTAYVEVNSTYQLSPATCSPSTLANCCGYGVYNVLLNGMINPTSGGEDGYKDYSCTHHTEVMQNHNYTFTVRTGSDNPQDTKVWIDYNNDGEFDDATELVLEDINGYDPQISFTPPTTGVILDTLLRMRVISDEVGSSISGCNDVNRGQAEDYGIKILADTTTPPPPNGIAENEFQFAVFPNPATDRVTISTTSKVTDIQIINLLGEMVINKTVIDSSDQIFDISNLPSGTYLVVVYNTANTRKVEKLIIK